MQADVVVLGAGAAGLMCALEAGKRGRKVVVLEHNAQAGRKILISGGGRCNFTNLHTTPANFLSANPHFCKSALARYTPTDFIALVEKHGIAYHEKKLGQLFCDHSARDIVDLFLRECSRAGVQFVYNCAARAIRRPDQFVVETNSGEFRAPALVVATGGLSIPKIGASHFGYQVARQFGLKVRPTRPALVPLTADETTLKAWTHMAGVAAEVAAATGGASFREKLLFTHRGWSGPAVLQISSYWDGKSPICVDLMPDTDLAAIWREHRQSGGNSSLKTVLGRHLPQRLADRWLDLHADHQPVHVLAERLHRWEFVPSGTEGYEKAEVTAGGVDTDELSSRTMEFRKAPGLYFVGELVDVTGHLGGFNFQWAWASGYAAGQAV